MRNIFLTWVALFLTVTQLQAQTDSIAAATVKIKAVNDTVYTIKIAVQVKDGWKVYDANAILFRWQHSLFGKMLIIFYLFILSC